MSVGNISNQISWCGQGTLFASRAETKLSVGLIANSIIRIKVPAENAASRFRRILFREVRPVDLANEAIQAFEERQTGALRVILADS